MRGGPGGIMTESSGGGASSTSTPVPAPMEILFRFTSNPIPCGSYTARTEFPFSFQAFSRNPFAELALFVNGVGTAIPPPVTTIEIVDGMEVHIALVQVNIPMPEPGQYLFQVRATSVIQAEGFPPHYYDDYSQCSFIRIRPPRIEGWGFPVNSDGSVQNDQLLVWKDDDENSICDIISTNVLVIVSSGGILREVNPVLVEFLTPYMMKFTLPVRFEWVKKITVICYDTEGIPALEDEDSCDEQNPWAKTFEWCDKCPEDDPSCPPPPPPPPPPGGPGIPDLCSVCECDPWKDDPHPSSRCGEGSLRPLFGQDSRDIHDPPYGPGWQGFPQQDWKEKNRWREHVSIENTRKRWFITHQEITLWPEKDENYDKIASTEYYTAAWGPFPPSYVARMEHPYDAGYDPGTVEEGWFNDIPFKRWERTISYGGMYQLKAIKRKLYCVDQVSGPDGNSPFGIFKDGYILFIWDEEGAPLLTQSAKHAIEAFVLGGEAENYRDRVLHQDPDAPEEARSMWAPCSVPNQDLHSGVDCDKTIQLRYWYNAEGNVTRPAEPASWDDDTPNGRLAPLDTLNADSLLVSIVDGQTLYDWATGEKEPPFNLYLQGQFQRGESPFDDPLALESQLFLLLRVAGAPRNRNLSTNVYFYKTNSIWNIYSPLGDLIRTMELGYEVPGNPNGPICSAGIAFFAGYKDIEDPFPGNPNPAQPGQPLQYRRMDQARPEREEHYYLIPLNKGFYCNDGGPPDGNWNPDDIWPYYILLRDTVFRWRWIAVQVKARLKQIYPDADAKQYVNLERKQRTQPDNLNSYPFYVPPPGANVPDPAIFPECSPDENLEGRQVCIKSVAEVLLNSRITLQGVDNPTNYHSDKDFVHPDWNDWRVWYGAGIFFRFSDPPNRYEPNDANSAYYNRTPTNPMISSNSCPNFDENGNPLPCQENDNYRWRGDEAGFYQNDVLDNQRRTIQDYKNAFLWGERWCVHHKNSQTGEVTDVVCLYDPRAPTIPAPSKKPEALYLPVDTVPTTTAPPCACLATAQDRKPARRKKGSSGANIMYTGIRCLLTLCLTLSMLKEFLTMGLYK